MAGPPKRRRAYLDDFVRDARGEYVYRGRRFRFDGSERARRRFCAAAAGLTVLAAFFVILQEWFAPVDMSSSLPLILLWLIQAVTIALTGWSIARMILRTREFRAYVYDATILKLPRRALAAAIACGASLAGQLIYLLVCRSAGPALPTWIRPACACLAGVACLLLRRVIRASRWTEIS